MPHPHTCRPTLRSFTADLACGLILILATLAYIAWATLGGHQ